MYGGFPYMFPNMSAITTPAFNGLTTAANLGNTANTVGALGTAGKSLFSKINWASLLSNTQKTLNVVNQAIPLYYQVKPVFQNMKTLGKIGKEFTKIGNSNQISDNNISNTTIKNTTINYDSQINEDVPTPKFFL